MLSSSRTHTFGNQFLDLRLDAVDASTKCLSGTLRLPMQDSDMVGACAEEWLPLVRDACCKAVREEIRLHRDAGLQAMRQIVREELDRSADEAGDLDSDSISEGEEDAEDDWKLIICVRHDLKMSIGKVAAQVGHAVHHAVTHSSWRDVKDWERSGSKKVTLKVDSEEQLFEIERKARSRGLLAESIQDAGHTEVDPGTTTVLAVGPTLARHLDDVTGHLRPLPDTVQQLEAKNKKLLERAEKLQKELDDEKRKYRKMISQVYACANAYRLTL